MRGTASTLRARRPPAGTLGLRAVTRALVLVAIAVGIAAALGFVFAGSQARLAEGVRVADVDVGGLTPEQARTVLERRARRLARVPVTFVAAGTAVRLAPAQLGLEVDWAAAVEAAGREADGFGPVRGLRRLETRVFGSEISPRAHVSASALRLALAGIGREVDSKPREAAIVLRGLRPRVVGERAGRALDRSSAERMIVGALTSLARTGPVELEIETRAPRVAAPDLRPALADVRTAVSGPVRLAYGKSRWRFARWRVAKLLALPADGRRTLAIGGPEAERLFERLGGRLGRRPRSAQFVARGDGSVEVVPSAPGRRLDEAATARALLAAATSPRARLARVSIATQAPSLTTAEARKMGITRVLATYTTAYAGTADRIRNLTLAVSLLDETIVRPGREFSLNRAVGERTLERGFRPAPVIIDDEYKEDVGGGVSQVATTAFNVAWEAGLKILERNPHSLYISRYPLGRDATVNYPDLDLRFLNDTGRPLVVRGFSTATGITLAVYGAATGRRVESVAGPLVVTGAVPVETIRDPTLPAGTRLVEVAGAPPRSVTVERTVYDRRDRVLYRETWRTSYRGEDQVVRLGTKPKPEPIPQPRPEEKGKAADEKEKGATTGTTETEPAETTPTPPPTQP